jgi:hypothetical protein
MNEDSIQLRTVDLEERDALVRQVALLSEALTNLEQAVERSRDLGIAVGLVMATEGVGRTQAFDLLRVVSQHQKRTLSVVADEVIETGGLPTAGDLSAIGSSVTCDQLADAAPQPERSAAARPAR